MSNRTNIDFLSDIRDFGVNFDIVWNIVIVELPDVVLQIEEIIRHESGGLSLTNGGFNV